MNDKCVRHSVVSKPSKMEELGEWERRKAYLTRCLFEGLPILSPISERRETEQSIDNIYNVLPDLIIEKEKNRHDEPEEFYQELEKRMLKLYRRLFLCQHDEGSVFSINSDHDATELINETSEDSDTEVISNIPDVGILSTPIDVSTRIPNDNVERELLHGSHLQDLPIDDDEYSEGPRHEVITTEALIHTRESPTNRNGADSELWEWMGRSPIIECKHMQQIHMDWDEQSSDRRLSIQDATFANTASPTLVSRLLEENVAGLVERQASQKYSTSISHEFEVYDFSPIEVMRQNVNVSKSSFPEVRHSRRSSMEPEIIRNLNEKEAYPIIGPQSVIEEEIASDAVSCIRESGPNASDLQNNALRELTYISSPILHTTFRKRLRSDSANKTEELPRKRTKYNDIGLQTTIEGAFSNVTQSCCEHSPTNYFYGTPMILNICRCKNHTCVL